MAYSQTLQGESIQITMIYSLKKTRLEHYRIRGIVLKWFTNYLTNRKQIMKYKYVKSEKLTIKCGVPQGSVYISRCSKMTYY